MSFLTLGPETTGEQFEVDTEAKLVHVASGVRLGVHYTELDKLGLALPGGGQCAPVCVGGLVGTDGVGFSARGFGFACDQPTCSSSPRAFLARSEGAFGIRRAHEKPEAPSLTSYLPRRLMLWAQSAIDEAGVFQRGPPGARA